MIWGFKTKATAVLIIGILGLAIFVGNIPMDKNDSYSRNGSNNLNTFSSFQEIQEYINGKTSANNFWNINVQFDRPSITKDIDFFSAPMSAYSESASTDYSTTNIQVEGVDEGDIVKIDGEYAYIVSRNRTKIYMLDVYPPTDLRILSQIELNWTISEIYLNENKLLILGIINQYYSDYYDYRSETITKTLVWVYDITDKSNPVLSRSEQLEGSIISSRMKGDYFYLIVSQPSGDIESKENLPAPPYKIHYIDNSNDNQFYFTNIISINVRYDSQDLENMIILMGSSNHIYVSTNNIYITCKSNFPKWEYSKTSDDGYIDIERTTIFRIAINKGNIEYKTSGTVPGRALNRFSMDEHKNYCIFSRFRSFYSHLRIYF